MHSSRMHTACTVTIGGGEGGNPNPKTMKKNGEKNEKNEKKNEKNEKK